MVRMALVTLLPVWVGFAISFALVPFSDSQLIQIPACAGICSIPVYIMVVPQRAWDWANQRRRRE